jgi:two-component system cell cycle sensor histidine kinase PleC
VSGSPVISSSSCRCGAARYVVTEIRNDRETSARQEIGLIATLIAQALAGDEAGLPDAGLAQATQTSLANALPVGALSDSRRIFVTDLNGDVLAAVPPLDVGPGVGLAEVIEQAQPLLLFGERAGVIEVPLGENDTALATARQVGGRLGSVVVLAPLSAIHRDWRGQVALDVSIFVGTSAILLVILYGYFAQATRASGPTASRRNAYAHTA